jgi:hypothetical protein
MKWYALTRAIELKEKLGGEVVAIDVGLADNEQNHSQGPRHRR